MRPELQRQAVYRGKFHLPEFCGRSGAPIAEKTTGLRAVECALCAVIKQQRQYWKKRKTFKNVSAAQQDQSLLYRPSNNYG